MNWQDRFANPQFVIALTLIALFGWAYAENVSDDTMKGALIAGFAGAWGYFLGSSRGAADSATRADKALDIAHEATRNASPDKPDVELKPGETARAVDPGEVKG